jgi:hypothetical protein
MKTNEPLDKKIIMHSNEDMNDTFEFITVEYVKSSLSNLKKRLKETMTEGVKRNDILPLDWCFDRVDDVFEEVIGKGLLEDEDGNK